MRNLRSLLVLLLFFAGCYSYSQNSSDWVSVDTIASVVKLGRLVDIYAVEGLPTNYTYSTIRGKPYFGKGRVLQHTQVFEHIGSGVVLTPDGWMISNAHVADENPRMTNFADTNDTWGRGASGKPVTVIEVSATPGFMFVSVLSKEDLAQNKRKLTLQYAAQIMYFDTDYQSMVRDRAVLKINKTAALLTANGLPQINGDLTESTQFSFVSLEDPFHGNVLDNLVRAIGYPGTGDPTFPAITKGENIGFESADKSNIIHTCYISNGNSGGGLFYNNALIGINTWDNQTNTSRPLAISQPVTYWTQPFAFVRLHYQSPTLPEINKSWIEGDPSTGAYTKEVYVSFIVKNKTDPDMTVNTGTVLAFRNDLNEKDLELYFELKESLTTIIVVQNMLQSNSIDEVVSITGLSKEVIRTIQQIDNGNIKGLLNTRQAQLFDAIQKDEFLVSISPVEADGKCLVAVPENSKVKILFVYENQEYNDIQILTVGSKIEQGPYTIRINGGKQR